jgi:hypothetical protein
MYFLYTSLADQILVHEIDYESVSEKKEQEPAASFLSMPRISIASNPPPNSNLSTGGGSFNYDNQQSSIFG